MDFQRLRFQSNRLGSFKHSKFPPGKPSHFLLFAQAQNPFSRVHSLSEYSYVEHSLLSGDLSKLLKYFAHHPTDKVLLHCITSV